MVDVVVTGAAGFIGHHLCRRLKEQGFTVRAVDFREPEYGCEANEADWRCDLREPFNALRALEGATEVYALAADMGGMGYIGFNHFDILTGNLRINLNTALAARACDVARLLYTSSACVYPERLQLETEALHLSESDAWDGMPDTAYGVEKLVSERIYTRMGEEASTWVHIARFHNIYGPEGTWRGGREKAPAALCRKVAYAAKDAEMLGATPTIEIWGDGQQTRSFCHISDCLEMLTRLMASDYEKPLNIGTDRLVTINKLVDIIARTAGIEVIKKHDLTKPQGVRGRNADLSEMKRVLDYAPRVSLENGMAELYQWIKGEIEDEHQEVLG